MFLGNIVWALLDRMPPPWDASAHMHIAFKYWEALRSDSASWFYDILSVEPFYPPLYHLSLVPFIWAMDFNTDGAVLLNSLCLMATILSVYGIGKELFDWRAGLWSALIVACYPFLMFAARLALIESMLVAAVSVSYYCFIRSEYFEDRRWTFVFSLSIALGMMVKWTFMFFLFPAMVFGLFGGKSFSFKHLTAQALFYLGMLIGVLVLPFLIYILETGRWIALTVELFLIIALIAGLSRVSISVDKAFNLLVMVGSGLMICFPWYAHTLFSLSKGSIKSNLSGLKEGDPTTGLDQWLYYLKIFKIELGIPLMVLFFVALAVMLWRRKVPWILLVWMAVPYVILSMLTNKDPRYIMPILPGMALVTGVFLTSLRGLKFYRPIRAGVLSVCLVIFFACSFIPWNEWTLSRPWVNSTIMFLGYWYPPSDQDWRIKQTLEDILRESNPAPGDALIVRTLTNHRSYQRGIFRNYSEANDLPIQMKSVKRNLGEFTDFFITKELNVGPSFSNEDINPKRVRLTSDPALVNTFEIFREYPLPDKSNGLVLKKNVKPATTLDGALDMERVAEKLKKALVDYPLYGFKKARNLQIEIVPTNDPADAALGRYASITARADFLEINKVPVREFEVVLSQVQINLYDLLLNNNLIFFELKRIRPRMTIEFKDLNALADKAMKGKGKATLQGKDGKLVLNASYPAGGMQLNAEAIISLALDPMSRLTPRLDRLAVGPAVIPRAFYRRDTDQEVALTPTGGWPIYTDIATLQVHSDRLEINGKQFN